MANCVGIDLVSGAPIEVRIVEGRLSNPRRVELECDDSRGLPFIFRGFVDMQVNGFKGRDYSMDGLETRHILDIIYSLAASGTTRHVPTIVTNARERIVSNLKTIVRARRESEIAKAAIVGCHIEGPFISSEDGPRGAHDGRYIRDPDFYEFIEWQESAEGLIRVVTVAPERKGCLGFIESVTKTGTLVAIGHSAADPSLIREAVAAGASLSTHLGNGSHATLPRLRNYIWEQLASDELRAGLIADGFHLPASVVKVIARAKGLDKLFLISDAAMPAGLEPGRHAWGNMEVELHADGHISLAGTEFLAGAGQLLDWDIPAFMRFSGASLAESVGLCYDNPIAILGLGLPTGPIATGEEATLSLFHHEPGAERLRVQKTVVAGRELFSR